MPPPNATRLITNGVLKPCHTARLYVGSSPPTTGRAAAAREAPTDHAGNVPTTRQASTSSSTGTRIQCGGSCGGRGGAGGGGPKNTSTVKRSEYATLNMPATVAATGSSHSSIGVVFTYTVSAKNISLDRKPLSSGTPAMAALATMPTAMNSEALKVAWFMMWNTAATAASGLFRPSSRVMRPRCEMVE